MLSTGSQMIRGGLWDRLCGCIQLKVLIRLIGAFAADPMDNEDSFFRRWIRGELMFLVHCMVTAAVASRETFLWTDHREC